MSAIIDWFQSIVSSQLFISIHVLVIGAHVILLGVAYLIYLERKISAYIQDRIGPNRVGFDFGLKWLGFLSYAGPFKGFLGLGQPLADGIKFLVKEDYTPGKVDKVLFSLAPILIVGPALIGFVVIPFGGYWDMPPLADIPIVGPVGEFAFGILSGLPLVGETMAQIGDVLFQNVGGERVLIAGADVSIGVVYLLAVASLGVYGVTLGGWASNSKFSFIGGLRATAQMISYEIPLGLSLIAAVLLCGSFLPQQIIEYQTQHGWLVIAQPIACVLFFLSILAEANRAPFDNAEAEQELVGGYHTEYSSMRFALFFLAEYAHMVTSAAFWVLLFFGGYHLPGLGLTDPAAMGLGAVIAKCLVFAGKVVLVIAFEMVIRWTLPRLRYDQIMMLGWQTLIPMSLTVVVFTSFGVWLGQTPDRSAMGFLPMLVMNATIGVVFYAAQGMFPRSTANKRVRLYGSRFFAPLDERVSTSPSEPAAREDRPVQGIAPIG